MNEPTADPIMAIEALIADRRAAINQLEAACATYRRAFGLEASTPSDDAVNGKRTRRVPLTDGALPDRIIAALKASPAPLKLSAIVNDVKASSVSVKAALKALVQDDRVTRTGKRAGTRYQA